MISLEGLTIESAIIQMVANFGPQIEKMPDNWHISFSRQNWDNDSGTKIPTAFPTIEFSVDNGKTWEAMPIHGKLTEEDIRDFLPLLIENVNNGGVGK